MSTVTITASKSRRRFGDETSQAFKLSFSQLPGDTFGPYSFTQAISQLRIAALLSPYAARTLVLDAATRGFATAGTGDTQS